MLASPCVTAAWDEYFGYLSMQSTLSNKKKIFEIHKSNQTPKNPPKTNNTKKNANVPKGLLIGSALRLLSFRRLCRQGNWSPANSS